MTHYFFVMAGIPDELYAPLPWPQSTIVVATDLDDVIGYNGTIPWKSSCDMHHFRRATHGKTVVMGDGTFKSLKCRALPGRRNVVLTRSAERAAEIEELGRAYAPSSPHEELPEESIDHANQTTLVVCTSMEQVFDLRPRHTDDALMIIGGESIYRQFMPHVSCVLMTILAIEVSDGDRFFPLKEMSECAKWDQVAYVQIQGTPPGEPDMMIVRFEKQ